MKNNKVYGIVSLSDYAHWFIVEPPFDNEPEKKEDENTGTPPVKKEEESSKTSDKEKDQKTFTQEDVDKIVQDRLSRERRKNEEELADKTRKAQEEEAKKQGDYKTLYENVLTETESLKAKVPKLETVAESVKKNLEERAAKLPDKLKELMPEISIDNLEFAITNVEKLEGIAKDITRTPPDFNHRGPGDQQTPKLTIPGAFDPRKGNK